MVLEIFFWTKKEMDESRRVEVAVIFVPSYVLLIKVEKEM